MTRIYYLSLISTMPRQYLSHSRFPTPRRTTYYHDPFIVKRELLICSSKKYLPFLVFSNHYSLLLLVDKLVLLLIRHIFIAHGMVCCVIGH